MANSTQLQVAPVLVLDDEPTIRDVVATCLQVAGYAVVQAEAGWQVLSLAREREFSVIVLDVNVPDMSGFDVCARLRREGVATPVIFLTARDGGADAAHGLRLGGDDYLRKPFDITELVARVDRLAGRRDNDDSSESLWCDDLQIDVGAMQARRGGTAIELTPTEFRTLEALVRNQGRVLTRFQLLDLVWDDDDRAPAMVDTVVSRLRRRCTRSALTWWQPAEGSATGSSRTGRSGEHSYAGRRRCCGARRRRGGGSRRSDHRRGERCGRPACL